MDIRNTVWLVSGGASGLGEATVRHAVALGGRAVIADLNESAGQALAAALGESARFIRCDVCDEAQVQAAVALAQSAFGGLQVAVNCAGISNPEKVIGKEGPHRLASFSRIVQVNLVGSFNLLRLAASAMATQTPNDGGERGVVINTASIAAYDGQIGQCGYAASKAGVVGLTLPAARELARYGVRVVTIAPGLFETPMMASLPKEAQDSLGRSVPFPPRLGRPEEYARLTQAIVENAMFNGETIRLDGALRMAPK
ncbi:MAG TPA: SDR family NAD(P)-dependent oxidoreductase [Nevskiaceae bacterium]|nr:SDR family NAD(P)-dependent oxidoreductase [Nevskiaceae bacterium]